MLDCTCERQINAARRRHSLLSIQPTPRPERSLPAQRAGLLETVSINCKSIGFDADLRCWLSAESLERSLTNRRRTRSLKLSRGQVDTKRVFPIRQAARCLPLSSMACPRLPPPKFGRISGMTWRLIAAAAFGNCATAKRHALRACDREILQNGEEAGKSLFSQWGFGVPRRYSHSAWNGRSRFGALRQPTGQIGMSAGKSVRQFAVEWELKLNGG